jgi:hypothetical protein
MEPSPKYDLPPFSDPALLDHWEEADPTTKIAVPVSSTFSDDLEAIHLVQEETTTQNNKEGKVIQHRAWSLAEVFRSDLDYPLGAKSINHNAFYAFILT